MNLFQRLAARKKLMDAFRLINDKQTPIIHDVAHSAKHAKYTFTLPRGYNPKLLHDKFFILQQFFGANIELTGEIKTFQLTVHTGGLPSEVKYRLNDWLPVINGMDIPVIAGVDMYGKKIAFDMKEAPHLLLTGLTGSGKSSALRAILTTLMLTKTPDEVRFMLFDMKLSEFGLFRNMPHVDTLAFEETAIEQALREVSKEMRRRGALLAQYDVPHVKDLPFKLPALIVCVDEVGLLRDNKKAMAMIEDISSIGRSLFVFTVLSMQRGDSKLLGGRLKLNLTVRMSGRQADAVNANIAGTPGAELIKLTERGKMILAHDTLQTIQTPFLPFEDGKQLLAPIKKVKPTAAEKIDTPAKPEFNFGTLKEV